MAAIPVTLDGVVYDLYNRTQARVIFFGDASLTGIGIGGGPIVGGPPSGAHPEHPIYYPPRIWGPPDMPPGFWGGGMGPGVKPQPPIQPPTEPPPPIDSNWQWGWNLESGWHPVWVPGDKPQPVPPS